MFSAAYLKDLHVNFIINYNRRSRADEEMERKTGEDTLKAQRDLMDRVLTPIGIPYDQLDEIGSGDKISTRPVFQGVLEDLRSGKYQAIAVKEISRLGRGSYTDMGTIYDLILDKRIFIITPWKVYDPQNPADLRQIRFELFMSREEFETTRERLTGGRFNKALEGRWMAGRAPFGYQLNPNTRKLEIHEEDAQVVRIIFDLFINGIPAADNSNRRIDTRHRAIGTYLMSKSIRTRDGFDRWRPDALKRILTNEVYIGTVSYRRTETLGDGRVVERPEDEHVVVYNAHEPIIDMDTWNKAQAKDLDGNYRPRVKPNAQVYEMTGLCVCHVCGLKMVRNEQKQKYHKANGEVNIYHKEFLVCGHRGCTMVKYQLVVEQLVEALHYFRDLNESEIEETLVPMLAEKPAATKRTIEDIEQYVQRRSVDLKTRMKFIREKYELGKYDDEEFEESRTEIQAEQEKLKQMLATYEKQTEADKPVVDVDRIKQNFSSAVSAYISSTEKQEKNQVLRSIFEKVYIEITQKGSGSIPSKFNIYPVLKHDFLFTDFLV